MKNKKYFCDWFEKHQGLVLALLLIISLVLFIEIVKWKSEKDYREYESNLNAEEYVGDENGYEILEEAIDTYIHQDGTINIQRLRELTKGKCLITEGEESFVILCSIDNKTRVKATVSNDFSTVTKERIQITREEHLEEKWKEIYDSNNSLGIWVWLIATIGVFSIVMVAYQISKIKKKKQMNQS